MAAKLSRVRVPGTAACLIGSSTTQYDRITALAGSVLGHSSGMSPSVAGRLAKRKLTTELSFGWRSAHWLLKEE
jgi:hypothetical protein